MFNCHSVVLIKHVDSDQLVLDLICFPVVKDLCEIVIFFLSFYCLLKGPRALLMVFLVLFLFCGMERSLTREIEEILTIDTKPGWKKGTKITFEEKGNERPNVTPADVVFIVDEKPHSEFTRDGNDLIVTRRISVTEAFTGYTVHLTTLDGRNLTLPINDVIHPNYQKVVPNEGMPILGDPIKRGILKIKFDIRFPTRVNAEQKAGIRRLFGA